MPVNHNKVSMSSNTGVAPPPLDRRSDRLWNHTRGYHNKVVYDDFNEYAFGLEYKGAPTTPFPRQLGQFAGPLTRQLSGSKRSIDYVSSNSNSYSKKPRSGIPLVETGYDISSCSTLEDGSRISEVETGYDSSSYRSLEDDEESEESIGCAKCYVPPSLYFLFGLRYPQKENPIEPMFRQHSICSASSWVQPSG